MKILHLSLIFILLAWIIPQNGITAALHVQAAAAGAADDSTKFSKLPELIYNNQTDYPLRGTAAADSRVTLTVSDGTHADIVKQAAADQAGKFSAALDLHSLNDGTLKVSAAAAGGSTDTSIVKQAGTYDLELKRWSIANDGTHPADTTNGINQALQWAHAQGITVFKVPAGTYLIAAGAKSNDPKARINMVSDMTFQLDSQAVIRKEANAFPGYCTMYIGDVHGVVIKGGTYLGDRDRHDYSAGGTQEGGYGIVTAGASNVTIEGIKSEKFTGDGLAIGGYQGYFQDVYAPSFESGAIDSRGLAVPVAGKTRTTKHWPLTDPSFQTTHNFVIANIQHLPWTFDVYFYKADGSFAGSALKQRKNRYISIPDGAVSFSLVFPAAYAKKGYLEIWNKIRSRQITVKDSEFAFNRRQGITVGGGNGVLIEHNTIHGQHGTAPQSGIDVEGGAGQDGFINSGITIRNNVFYNNKAYDVILYDGHDATVEDNTMGSKGVIGLAVSPPFTNAVIKNNLFKGTSIYIYHDVTFKGNEMDNAFTHIEGPNVKIDGMAFVHSKFVVSSTKPFGVTGSDITLKQSDFSTWGAPVHFTNMTVIGGSMGGSGKNGNIFDNLKVIGHKGSNFPRGTYNHCLFQAADGSNAAPHTMISGTYVFNQCTFKGTGVAFYHKDDNVTVENSTFDINGSGPAISVQAAQKADLENNTITADHVKRSSIALIAVGYYWDRNKPVDIHQVTVKGNSIAANAPCDGIQTVYAGTGAPSYDIENNTLHRVKLDLKNSDINRNNKLLP